MVTWLAANRTYLGKSIPFEWVITQIKDNCASYRNLLSMLIVSESVHEANGQRWLHVSVSHSSRMPTWGELQTVKSIWIGDRVAYHVLPRAVKFTEDADDAYTLHLWCPLDGDPFPFEMRGAA
jgi:hypothetical protein